MSLKRIENFILENDPNEKVDSTSYRAQVVLLASVEVGPSIKKLAKFTGYPRGFVAQLSKRLRSNGVWHGHKVACDWWDKETGGVAFMADTCVALGYLERRAD